MRFQKFAPLTKIEEQADGSLHVFGTVTAEQPDLDKEVCDYAGTKPYYEKRTSERLAITSKIAGMEPSLMAMRAQHDPHQAIGAGRSLVCDDSNGTIKMGFAVVDAEAIKKWKAGVFIGFSQGGEYVKRWPDPVHEGCTRYIADPAEVSAVDSPCLPSALAESMKGRTVTLQKAAGVAEEVPLQVLALDTARLIRAEREIGELRRLLKEAKTKTVDGVALPAHCFAHVGDPEETSTWKLPIEFPGDEEKTKSHIRNALARFEQTEGMSAEEKKAARAKIVAAAKKHGIEVSDSEKVAISRACANLTLEKGLYEVGWLASLLEDMHWLCLQTEFERDQEDDGSKVPEEMRASWLKLLETFKAMAEEEADELAATGGKGAGKMKITDQAGLTKAAKTLHEHLEKHMEMHKAHHELIEKHLAKDHPIMKGHQALMDHCDKCLKAAKDAVDGEEPKEEEKVLAAGSIAKAIEESPLVLSLKKSIEDLTAKLATTPAPGQNLPHSGAGGPMEKSAKADADFAALLQ